MCIHVKQCITDSQRYATPTLAPMLAHVWKGRARRAQAGSYELQTHRLRARSNSGASAMGTDSQ
jgi:hypothetical protein